ncbi:benzyl alcohol O-benzoyltransferase-like [Salvia hispanica]|uniref:benzyl alcohol O-benzoyltransferase-like n=1 Tax=Salvia hispanica TaxID=49212 RepID=UPI0020097095|nr:benzyl alcohol O-benzoyltransferase-like [Salvia hispanica]
MQSTINFNVARKKPELIAPARPTPHEFKVLSDIDDQEGLRFQIPVIQFYRRNLSSKERDPVKVIRDAIANALVYYYPFAGRLREHTNRKLVVECNGEGVVFIEADADVALQHLGDSLYPPFPYLDKLLHSLPATAGIINCPLLLIQVTRLKCGGFVVATRLNHTMSDAAGLAQFLSAVGEFAREDAWPSIQPVWERHLLSARNPPCVTCTHHEYGENTSSEGNHAPPDNNNNNNMVDRSFLFTPADISALRRSLPPYLRGSSSFEIATTCTWRCRAISLSLKPKEEIGLSCLVNVRKRLNPPLPVGYYGNAIVYPAAVTTAEKLTTSPLQHAVELLRNAKSQAAEEYVKSVADLMVMRGRPCFNTRGIYLVSDVTRSGLGEVDYGWGTAEYGGPALCGIDLVPGVVSFALPYKNTNGEKGIRLTMSLPPNAMDKFINELETAMATARRSLFIRESAL